MKKTHFIHLVAVVLLMACTAAKQADNKDSSFYTLEQFGGQAWYLPTDGRLQDGVAYPLINFTPASADANFLKGLGLTGTNYTLITVQSNKGYFTKEIVGKSFCGLFVHQNDPTVNHQAVDAFYPQILGSRYAKVVHYIDTKNVIVDFEYNGGNPNTPQKITNGKGYFFHDNTAAWERARQVLTAKTNHIEDLKLEDFTIKNGVQSLYVIPQYQTWKFTSTTPCRIWSGTKNLARLKIGFEDHYQHEKSFGQSGIHQDAYLFGLPGGETDHDLLVHAKIYPPHRTVLESSTFRRTFFVGRKAGGITALVGATQRDEERYILAGKGKTEETFISWSFSAISSGGRLTSPENGILQDVAIYGYVLCKDYEQRGQMFTQMNATKGGGNYLVVEDAFLDFKDQSAINPPSQSMTIKLNRTTAYAGFPDVIQTRSKSYLPYTFEIVGNGNFFQVFALGGSNRTNIVAIQGEAGVLAFLANTQGVNNNSVGEFSHYWESCYVPKSNYDDWSLKKGEPGVPGRTASKLMLFEQIPVKNQSYTISRHYEINETFEQLIDSKSAKIATVNRKGSTATKKPNKGNMFSNVVRTAVCWTTVLQKYGSAIESEKEVPANGKPLALQPGDQFTIPAYKGSSHNPKTVYTVQRKERGPFPSFPAEFVGIANRKDWLFSFSNAQSYRYFWCELDQDLPAEIGLTFEITMVHSTAEVLLDQKPRAAVHTYKGIAKLGDNGTGVPNSKNAQGYGGYGIETLLNSKNFASGEPLGHLCYSQVEITEWYKNVHWNNGYYRQNTNSGRGFESFDTKDDKGATVKVNPLARYSAGKTFINCTGGPIGQYSNGCNDFQVRDWILNNAGKKQSEGEKAKLRLYNSPEVRTIGVKNPEKYVESYATDKNAPDMPKVCRELLNGLEK